MANEQTSAACLHCGNYIWEKKNGIKFLDQMYHRVCLVGVLAAVDIHIELANMGLDQPPPDAA